MPSGIYKRTDSHRRLIADGMRGNKNAEGHFVSKKARALIGKASSLALKGRKLSPEHKRRISKSIKGTIDGSNRFNNVSRIDRKNYYLLDYVGRHKRIYLLYGKPTQCENEDCAETNHNYQWANVSGQYKLERKDWKELCVPCHVRYDRGRKVKSLHNELKGRKAA